MFETRSLLKTRSLLVWDFGRAAKTPGAVGGVQWTKAPLGAARISTFRGVFAVCSAALDCARAVPITAQ